MLRAYFIDYAGEFVDKKVGNSIFDRLLQAPATVVAGPVGATANTFKEFDQVRDFFTSATLSLVVDLPFIFLFIFVIYPMRQYMHYFLYMKVKNLISEN